MKIYTGTGDKGKTSLFSGERISKSDDRIDAYGDLDELNSILGALMAHLVAEAELVRELQQIQSDLFRIGAWLATRPDSAATESLKGISKEQIVFLENAIDRLEKDLPDLKGFILPGGHILNSYCHICRTITRRAERALIRLSDIEEVNPIVIKYLNRLSDYFFTLARKLSKDNNGEEIPWKEEI